MPRSTPPKNRHSEAERLRKVRDALGLSQREFAHEFKVAHGAVAQWESGKRSIPGPVLRLIELYEEELGMKDESLEKLMTSWSARTLKLSRTAAGITARMVANGLERVISDMDTSSSLRHAVQVRSAEQIAKALGEMKGLAMKLGQMASYLDFAVVGLPEEARAALSMLQSATTPMSPAAVAEVFVGEFGKTPRQLFADWEPVPFAAASIGQVHRARLHSGESVAVKVQYPGVEKTLKADLKNVALLERFGQVLFRGQKTGEVLSELKERFTEECDYLLEARNQEEFRTLFCSEEIVVPRVFSEFSSKHVLCSEFVAGESFQSFCARASQAQKNRAGEVIYQVAFQSIFRHHLFNGDPHPGNYLFSDGKVVFLDFGCVKRFSPEFISTWKRLVRANLTRDRSQAEAIFVEMGFVPNRRKYDFLAQHRMFETLYQPWLVENFRFTPEFVTQTWRDSFVNNPNKFQMNMPKDWVFLNRLQWGLFSVLAALRSTANWRKIIDELVAM